MATSAQFSMFDVMQWLPPEEATAFDARVKRRAYQPGQLVYAQGDIGTEMYRVISGEVRMLARTEEGREVVFLRFGPGDCFGLSSLIDGQPRPHTAEAAVALELDVLTRSGFDALRTESRAFDGALLKLIARMMRYSSKLFRELSLNAIEERIAIRILHGVEAAGLSEGLSGEAAEERKLALSQSEIALMVGASRQTVNRILNVMEDAGILTTEYNNIVVKDLDGLQNLALRTQSD